MDIYIFTWCVTYEAVDGGGIQKQRRENNLWTLQLQETQIPLLFWRGWEEDTNDVPRQDTWCGHVLREG